MDEPVRQATREDYEERIVRVQRHIHQHLDEPLSLNQLAQIACFSRCHFHRIFAAMVGETPADYVRRLRLERAADQLVTGGVGVGEAAQSAGYDSPEAFSRVFHERYGMPPAEYRQHHGGGSSQPEASSGFTARIIRYRGVSMEVKIQKMGPWTVASMRHTGPYEESGQVWQELMSKQKVRRAFRFGTLCMSICYDDPEKTAPDQIRMDACVTVGKGFQAGDGVERQEIPAGDYAVLRHTGPYGGLMDCYKYIYGEWLPQSGREPADRPCLEIYRNNPQKTPEHKLITDICVPLR